MLQNSGKGERLAEESKGISSGLASAINDGLCFFEEVIRFFVNFLLHLSGKQKQKHIHIIVVQVRKSNSRQNKPIKDCVNHHTEGSSSVGPENSNSRRKQNRGSSKQYKQRLFHGQNTRGMISESPPSDAVGFFFDSTPPDSHG